MGASWQFLGSSREILRPNTKMALTTLRWQLDPQTSTSKKTPVTQRECTVYSQPSGCHVSHLPQNRSRRTRATLRHSALEHFAWLMMPSASLAARRKVWPAAQSPVSGLRAGQSPGEAPFLCVSFYFCSFYMWCFLYHYFFERGGTPLDGLFGLGRKGNCILGQTC